MSRARGLAPGEYYHVFNRGAHKAPLFRDRADWLRFLFLAMYSQSSLSFPQVGRLSGVGSAEDGFPVELALAEEIIKKRSVELTAFALMPNHFHLLLLEKEEGGIAHYMQRVQLGYTHYFNKKYGVSGHLFQGTYKAVHVKDDTQLMHLSAYIHRNPRELKEWKGKEESYPWSSLQDYVAGNRWGGLLATDIIASRFEGTPQSNYRDFVRTSSAKMLEEEFGSRNV
jgi:putative transposase